MKKVILLFVVFFVISGCMVTDLVLPEVFESNSPTSTPLPTFELFRTSTPSPTRTPVPVDPNIQYRDDFSDDNSGWLIIDDKTGKMQYSDGMYTIYQKASDQIVWDYTDENFRNGIFSIDYTTLSGDEDLTGVAILWRVTNDNEFYLFQVNEAGYYWVTKWEDNDWIPIKRKSNTAALKQGGQMNNLKIAFHGNSADIFINDYFVDSFTDKSFISGSAGMGVWADPESDVEIAFDNLVVYEYDENSPWLPSKSNTIDSPEGGSTYSDEDCVRWDLVTIEDVGKTMCVYGTVRTSWYSENKGAYIITFSEDPEAVYFALYGDWAYQDGELIGNCVMFTSEISKVYNTPVMYIQADDDIYKCTVNSSGEIILYNWNPKFRGVKDYVM